MASLRLSLLLSLLPATAAAARGEPGFVGGHASGSDVAKLAATCNICKNAKNVHGQKPHAFLGKNHNTPVIQLRRPRPSHL